jgi:transporter family-2 protein
VERILALIATLVVGGLVALQPPANAMLARHVGDIGDAFTSLVLSTMIVGVLLVGAGQAGELGGLSEFRWVHTIGAIGGAAVVLVTLITVRHLGATALTAALVSMQLIVSAIIDRLGILGLEETPLTSTRLAGVGLLIVGTLLVTSK